MVFPATSVNAGMLVGHNTLRLMAMGMAQRAPTANELAQMVGLLEAALAAGALGLSSGLFTAPGSYAEPAELIALGHVVKRHNASYFTHLRDESRGCARFGRRSDRDRRDLRHPGRDRASQMLGYRLLGQGADHPGTPRGGAVRAGSTSIAMPIPTGRSNPLKNLLPQWVQAGGMADMLARLRSPRRGRASATISRATGSTTGAACRPGTGCGSRSSPHLTAACRPDHRAARRGARRQRDRHAVRFPDRGPRCHPGCTSPRLPRTTCAAWCARRACSSARTAIA
ncbi:MAG: hypothetical protein WDO24_09325 [Pseudomonadota bacterium]